VLSFRDLHCLLSIINWSHREIFSSTFSPPAARATALCVQHGGDRRSRAARGYPRPILGLGAAGAKERRACLRQRRACLRGKGVFALEKGVFALEKGVFALEKGMFVL